MRRTLARFGFACTIIAGLLALSGRAQTVATVTTDRADYRPGDTALITGNGFGATESVTLQVTHLDDIDEPGAGHEPWTVATDSQGHFETTWYVDPDDSVGATLLLTAVSQTASAQTTFTDRAAATIEQCRNGGASSPNDCLDLGGGTGWVPGNAGAQTSHYVEGYSIPYRTTMTQLPIGQSISIDLGYDVKHSGAHAIDFLTHFQRLESHAGFGHPAEIVNPLSGVAGASNTISTFAIPAPSTAGSPVAGQPATRFNALPAAQRVMTLFGGTITGVQYVTQGSLTASQSETVIRVTLTPDSATAVLAWGGHIARAADWGQGNSAGGINGSPYHMRLKDWRCEDGGNNTQCDQDLGNLGNQDRSLSADAVFPTGTVVITKQIVDDGGNNTFSFSSTGLGADSFSLTTTDPSKDATRTFTEVLAGRPIAVTELTPPTGWAFVDLVCTDPDGGTTTSNATRTATIDLDANETVSCVFSNREDFNVTRGKIIVQKVTVPSTDTTTVFDFTSSYGPLAFTLRGGESNDSGFIAPGSYSVSENAPLPAGWSQTSATCSSSLGDTEVPGAIELDAGETVTCTFTNTKTAHLKLVKTVTNDNGGTAAASAWTLSADGAGANDHSGAGGFDLDVPADTYALSESTGPAGYTAGSWSCTGGSQNGAAITLAAGDSATCTINNDDQTAHLKLLKTVTNNNGGQAVATDWTLSAAGPTPISGAGGAESDVNAGSYSLSESTGPAGYTAGSWSCTGGTQNGASIALALGQSATCTINNDDQTAHLKLLKTVTNNNGGQAVATDWTLSAAGPTPLSGAGGAESDVNAGSYSLSESTGPAGYTAGSWSCTGGTQNGASIALALGQSATCTINNDDQTAHLKLVKTVTNDNGGQAVATDWTLSAAGPTPLSGAGGAESDVNAGSYTLSEAGGPAGYTASAWSCTGGTQNGTSIALALGQSATCTINNNDQTAHLKLVKVVTNNNGGSALATAWTLSATGPTPLSGAGGAESDVNAGSYTLGETGPAGYTASAWSCTGGTQNSASITLALGQSATCTITNDDQPGMLQIVKIVKNDNGGTATVSAFGINTTAGMLTFDGGVANGTTTTYTSQALLVNAGTWTLRENDIAGYTEGTWTCTGATATDTSISKGEVTVPNGVGVVCTITNDDQPGTIVIVKNAKPQSGTFTFSVTGSGYQGFVLSGDPTGDGNKNTQANLSAGTYTVQEATQLGWILTGIGGGLPVDPTDVKNTKFYCSTNDGIGDLVTQTATIDLKNGQTVTCTFENTGQGVTRTQGFWATHTPLANIAWFGGSAFGHTFPGVTGTAGVGNQTLCDPVKKDLNTLARLMGGFWSDVSKTTTNSKRSALDQARMQLLQQLLAAELNASAFGSAPAGGMGQFAIWEAAYCGTNQTAIQNALQGAASFNNSGDSATFTPGTSADSKNARAIADRVYWNVLP